MAYNQDNPLDVFGGNDNLGVDGFGVKIEDTEERGFWEDEDSGEQKANQEGEQNTPGEKTDNAYRYFQSMYDKERNRTSELEKRLAMYETAGWQNVQEQEPKEEDEEFPPPPQPPRKPSYFNPADISMPESESAKYYADFMSWQEQMANYNLLKADYVNARAAERYSKLEKMLEQQQQQRALEQQRAGEVARVVQFVQQKYGVDYNTALDFVNEMSQPQPTVDDLWGLYQIKSGKQPNYAGGAQIQRGPSRDFTQMQRAQSVPPAMSVMAGLQPNTDPYTSMIDKIITNENGNYKY